MKDVDADLVKRFRTAHGYPPDLENPSTFSEKLFHRIALDDDPLFRICANKHLAPYYARSRAGDALDFAERYAVFTKIESDDIDALPESFVLKGSHASGLIEIVADRDSLDRHAVTERFNARVRTVRNAKGVQDHHAVILAEELLVDPLYSVPVDYKFHCFRDSGGDGFRWILQVDIDRFGAHTQSIYDETLRPLDFTWAGREPSTAPFERPAAFDRMVTIADRLSADFDYMRVDLYDIDGRVVFGEFTPFHHGGRGRIDPRAWDDRLGEMWTLRNRPRHPRFSADFGAVTSSRRSPSRDRR